MTAPARRTFIGGSDIAAILGISPWKTAVDLWMDKTAPSTAQDKGNLQAKNRGTRLEPYILDMIREEYGIEVVARNQRYSDADYPHFACEIDAETEDENIEIKTVHPFKSADWGTVDTDQLPIHYVAQVQWGLGIRKKERCRVFALIGDDLRPYVVERDDETIQAIRAKAAEFWTRYVLAGLRPPIDYTDRKSLDSLRRLYPGTDGTTIDATAEHEHWRAVLQKAQEMAARYEGVIDGAKAHILAEMGTSAVLKFNDGKGFRRKEISKKPYTVEYQASRYIDFRLVNIKEE